MKNVTFQKFLQITGKHMRWWLITHRKEIKGAAGTIALAAGMIGLPVLMFADWLLWGYQMTGREKIMAALLLVIAGRKLWKEEKEENTD